MPLYIVSDIHKWMKETPIVPTYYLAKPQPREQAWQNHLGKKTLLSLTLVGTVKRYERCRVSGRTGKQLALIL